MLCCAAPSSQGVCDVLQRLLDFTNYLIHLVDCHLSYKPDQECSKTLLANQLAWLRSMTSPTLTSWASPIRPSRWSSSWTSSPSPRSYSPSLPPSATVLVAAMPRWRRCWQGQRGLSLQGGLAPEGQGGLALEGGGQPAGEAAGRQRQLGGPAQLSRTSWLSSLELRSQLPLIPRSSTKRHSQAAGSGNLDLGEGKRKVKVEDAKVLRKSSLLLIDNWWLLRWRGTRVTTRSPSSSCPPPSPTRSLRRRLQAAVKSQWRLWSRKISARDQPPRSPHRLRSLASHVLSPVYRNIHVVHGLIRLCHTNAASNLVK